MNVYRKVPAPRPVIKIDIFVEFDLTYGSHCNSTNKISSKKMIEYLKIKAKKKTKNKQTKKQTVTRCLVKQTLRVRYI